MASGRCAFDEDRRLRLLGGRLTVVTKKELKESLSVSSAHRRTASKLQIISFYLRTGIRRIRITRSSHNGRIGGGPRLLNHRL